MFRIPHLWATAVQRWLQDRATIEHNCASGERDSGRASDIELILDFTDKLFEDVLNSDNSDSGAELVHHGCEFTTRALEFFKQFNSDLRLRNHQHIAHHVSH